MVLTETLLISNDTPPSFDSSFDKYLVEKSGAQAEAQLRGAASHLDEHGSVFIPQFLKKEKIVEFISLIR